MTDFVSVFDLLESDNEAAKKTVRDEVADIQYSIRRAMDAGLSPDEMKAAQALNSGLLTQAPCPDPSILWIGTDRIIQLGSRNPQEVCYDNDFYRWRS